MVLFHSCGSSAEDDPLLFLLFLQTRLTADKSMRLLLSTFSSLREELMHMSEDLRVSLILLPVKTNL